MTVPQTSYTSLGEADIAYQVLGAGPPDLVYVNGLTEHIDLQWDHPLMARFLERLASFSRLIMFDRRGAGASDPVPLDALPTWEEWTEDLRAVLDAVGSERAAIYAELDAGPVGMIFAATHPERTAALVLGNTAARYAQAEDYPEGATPEAVAQIVELFRATWGTEQLIAMVFPSMASDPGFLRWRARFTPGLGHPAHGRGPVSLHLRDGRAVGAGHHRRPDPGTAPVQLLYTPHRPRPLSGRPHPGGEVGGGRRG